MIGVRYTSQHVVLEPSSWQIRVGADVFTPEPKVFELLAYLMRHNGRVVTKNELLDSLWAGVVVGESALTRCMSYVRKLLADDARAPKFIRTAHGRGYEFVAQVSLEQTNCSVTDVDERSPTPVPSKIVGASGQHSEEFKRYAVRVMRSRVERVVAQVGEDLGVNPEQLHDWATKIRTDRCRDLNVYSPCDLKELAPRPSADMPRAGQS
jgi:DNA-binding winged helix-turn-helix (wHTH) protein